VAERDKLYMGIDVGSVSLNIAIIDEQVNLLDSDLTPENSSISN